MKRKRLPKKDLSRGFRIAIYIRVSTEEQAENPEGSIKTQEQRLREFIKLKNMVENFGEVKEVYSDPGISAKNMNRPGFQKMLTAIQNHEIDLVLVTEISRFSRSTKDFTMLQDFLEEHDCKFLSLRENFDTSGAAGSMVLNMMATIAEFERRQTAERISSAFLARAKRGLYNGGSLPLGYRIDPEKPGHLFIDPEEAEIVKLTFHAFLKHETLAATCKFLNSQKIRLPKRVHGSGAIRESQFTIDALYRILKNKAYIGTRVFHAKNESMEVPAVWESILDKESFDRANVLLAKNCHHKRTHGANRFPYTLSGLVFCESCGDRMSGKSAHGSGGKVGYYAHNKISRLQSGTNERLVIHEPHRVPSVKLEPAVWQEVKSFLLNDAFAESLLERARSMQDLQNKSDESEKILQKIHLTSNQIEVLAERIASLPAAMDAKPLVDQLSKLQTAKVQLQEDLVQAKKEKPESDEPISLQSLSIFRKGLKQLIEKGEKDPSIQAAITKKVVHKITIQPNGFEIHFHVGKTYYTRELGKHPGSRFFAFEPKNSDSAAKSGNFFKDRSSTLLTNGDLTPS
ncbi:MAG: recombinase family protein [Pseudobdellovibrionaceae bacterium]